MFTIRRRQPVEVDVGPGKRFAIFDMDGTLLDTEPLHTIAIDELLAPYGKRLSAELKARMMGRPVREAAAILIEDLQLPITPDEYARLREPILRRVTRDAPEIPGACAFVSALAQHGIPVALATSTHEALARHKLGDNPMQQHFAAQVFGDDPGVVHPKPAPDIFLEAARRLGADPMRTLVFEDSEAGALAAQAAGMEVVLVAPLGPRQVSFASAQIADFQSLDPAVWFESVRGTSA